jgi:hypothetical protein
MSVVLQFNLLQIQGGSNDSVWGLRYRYDL